MKSFKQMFTERVQYDNWIMPDEDALRLEYKIEYQIKPMSRRNLWPEYEDFKLAIESGEVRTVDRALDRKIDNRSNTQSYEDLLGLIKGYASYPEFRNEKTLKNLYSRIENNQPLNLPMVIDFGDGSYRVFSGNTRMDVAFQLGVNPKALFIKPKASIQERNNFNNEQIAMVSYAIVIAEHYHRAPLKDPQVMKSYEATIQNIETLYERIQSRLGIEIIPTEQDPYASDEEMIRAIAKEKKIKVYTGDSDHPFYSPEINVKFRAVHDIFSHYMPHKRSIDKEGNVKFKGYDFSYPGELDAYYAHKKYSKRACHPAYFSEVVGQVSYQAVTGKFGKQKMVWFGDIADMNKIGQLKGEALQRQRVVAQALVNGEKIPDSPIPGLNSNTVLNAKPFKGKGGKF